MMEIDKHLMPGKLTKITHSFVITIHMCNDFRKQADVFIEDNWKINLLR